MDSTTPLRIGASTSSSSNSSSSPLNRINHDSVNPDPATDRPKKRRKPDKDSLNYALTSGFAGGIAGCVAKTSVAPLDRVKILFQTRSPDYARYAGTWFGVFRASKDIYAETGVRGLLQGHSATLIRIFPYAAIKFMAYERFHSFLMPTPSSETSIRRFLAGSLAGITTTGITYPLELIRVRLAFEPHHSPSDKASLLRTIRAIYLSPCPPPSSSSPSPPPLPQPSILPTTTGRPPLIRTKPPSIGSRPPLPSPSCPTTPSMTHFYRGVFPTLAGIIPYAGTSFVVWGYLKTDLFPSLFSSSFRSKHRSSLDLLAGGAAGAIGQTTAYPLDIVRRRMQVGPVLEEQQQEGGGKGGGGLRGKQGFKQTAKHVLRTQGWRGFFVGLSIGYLKVVPMNSISFAVWVGMKRVLGLEEEEEVKVKGGGGG